MLQLASELAGTVVPTPFGLVRLTRAMFSRVFGIPRSAFYRSFGPKSRPGDARIVVVIRDVLAKHPRYGYRQVTSRLRRCGIAVNAKRTLRLMRERGLLAKPPRRPKWRSSGSKGGDLPNLSRFTPTKPNQLWSTDFTFVRICSAWAYLSVMLDGFSRNCVGWSLGMKMTTDLAIETLEMALVSRRPKGTVVHHSDRGGPYVSALYQETLAASGAEQSFSRPGTPTDNPVCERFIGTLKREEIWVKTYTSLEDAERSIGAFIRDYNLNRAHSSLGKRSPIEFERMHHNANPG